MTSSLSKELPPERTIQTEHGDIFIYRLGIGTLCVCAPKILDGEQITSLVSQRSMDGIVRKWNVASSEYFSGEQHHPESCNEENENRLHWMLIAS